ncbi:mitofilin family membrane protein [Hoeflea sp. BAL378]|uniref:COG4223 family protein n=1 Tax=Hoeflea sp. BAL378 TaxID=1547437 RepID=UPI000AE18480|nr:mitofilin family membrane protein [Hoeflea sp. BAL378]
MSKGPTPRHSKSPEPVTIDLDATDVTPKNEDLTSRPAAAGPATSAPASAKPGEPASAAKTDAASAGTGPSSAPSGKGAEAKTDAKAGDAAAFGRAAGEPKSSVPPAGTRHPADEPETATARPGDGKPASSTPGSSTGPASSAAKAKPSEARTGDSGPASPAATNRSGASAKSGGGVLMLASGLIGAVIALGGGYALQASGVLPAPGGSADQVQALSSRLDAVSSSVETLTSQSAGTGDADMAAQLSARLDRLETSLNEAAAAGGTADPAAIAAVNERFAALEATLAQMGAGSGAADPAVTAGLDELRAAQSGLQTAVSELQTQTSTQVSELSARIAAVEQGQTDLAARLDEPGRQIDLARAIAAAGLKSAIDRGGSFMTELEAFASVAPDDPAVPELRDLAASGVPSRSRLIEQFPEAATAAIAAAEPVDPEQGLVDRLMSSALSVVKVRQVGDVEGDSAEAIAARAEARLMDGDLDAALAEWNQLPEASKAAAAGFGDSLAARARAEKLIAASMAPGGAPASTEAPAN